MNGAAIVFDPLLPFGLLLAAAALALAMIGLAAWRGLAGWALRGLSLLVLLAALLQPSLQQEEREYLSDIVVMVVDETASQGLGDRAAQTAAAVARVEAEVAALPNTELRILRVADAAGDAGSLVMTALAQAVAEAPRARLAGAILVTDGRVHDIGASPPLPAALNTLLTGFAADWDRRLHVTAAPAFGIIGEPLSLSLRIDEQGNLPPDRKGRAVNLSIAVDGGLPETYSVPPGEDHELQVTLSHGGQNVIQLSLEPDGGELTDRNNSAVLQINGVRDRLRVLLVSGEPYAGERTWRNLLKSDAAVDLVHFTILRPPEKQDGVPVEELSLIAFPTRELFVEKINEFDLIIFDRYKTRGILPSAYLDNIRDYVMGGGAVLVAAGPEFGSVESLYYSGLGEILPGAPTGRIVDEGYRPLVTGLGRRHPVTEGLDAFAPAAGGEPDAQPSWGRWLRTVEVTDLGGQVVMSGAGERPLLLLNRVGEGRVALLASDQAWLWSRGFEGGGPQLELLRRLAHWMMKEPDLEEEALNVTASGLTMTVTRRTLTEGARQVTITGPDGAETLLPLTEEAPGRHVAVWTAPAVGLYRLSDGGIERVYALGPASPREFEDTIATPEIVAAVAEPTNGGAVRLEDGMPDVRQVRAGRPASGRGWIGITPREAYLTTDVTIRPLLPGWALLALAALLAIAAWLREGRAVTRRA